jgi:hypothetical protein
MASNQFHSNFTQTYKVLIYLIGCKLSDEKLAKNPKMKKKIIILNVMLLSIYNRKSSSFSTVDKTSQ